MYITYYIDNNNNYEGIGAQFQRIIGLLAIAKRYNLKYIHIMPKIGHNYKNDPEWDDKWNNMFNIKKIANNNEEISLLKNEYNSSFTIDILEKILRDKNENILNSFLHPFEIFDKNPDYFLSNIQEDLIKAYDENNNTRKLIYDKNKINIAIHIRVYNDYDDKFEFNNYNQNSTIRFYMTCEKYINLINLLNEKYSNSDIHIFSQEKYFDLHYKKLRDMEGIKLHFDDLDTFDTFHHLCKSDIFCMGTSSFSMLAGFYNNNTVIYLPYHHPPSLNKWLIYNA